MAAKVMLAKHSGNVGNHSFEFLGWDKPPTPGISGGHAPLIIRLANGASAACRCFRRASDHLVLRTAPGFAPFISATRFGIALFKFLL